MTLKTLLISGPAHAGKSDVARLASAQVQGRRGHLLRLYPARDGYTNTVTAVTPCPDCDADDIWGSIHYVHYTPERVFETIPDALRAVRQLDRRGFVVIEADADGNIRHAFPYDYRVFVMPSPRSVYEVFRDPQAAGAALQQVMQDTAAFASEIFGLFDGSGLDDSVGVQHHKASQPTPRGTGIRSVETLEVHQSQLRQFLRSPIGIEIASRIQLQPDFHALVEADVALVNFRNGNPLAVLEECIQRLQKLLGRIRHDARRRSVLYWGDVANKADPTRRKLIRRFKTLLNEQRDA